VRSRLTDIDHAGAPPVRSELTNIRGHTTRTKPGRRVPERAQIVLLVLDLVADQLATGSVVTVDNERVRIRPLPVGR
jgi:hypothetical protein